MRSRIGHRCSLVWAAGDCARGMCVGQGRGPAQCQSVRHQRQVWRRRITERSNRLSEAAHCYGGGSSLRRGESMRNVSRRTPRLASFLVLGVLLSGCTSAAPAAPTPAPTTAPAKPTAAAAAPAQATVAPAAAPKPTLVASPAAAPAAAAGGGGCDMNYVNGQIESHRAIPKFEAPGPSF